MMSCPAKHLSGLVLAAFALLAPAAPSAAAEEKEFIVLQGGDDYRFHCVACHGHDARGDGTMAKILAVPPADLTGIAARNGGAFPFWRVYTIISGEMGMAGHQTFQMPGYWKRFERDEDKPGYLPAYLRILLLTHYLASIQAE